MAQTHPDRSGHDPSAVDPHHGNSVAAWTAVGLIIVGATVAAFGVALTNLWLGVAGAVVIVLGAVAGKALGAMGFGASGRPGT